jgi:hypothetical protein
MMLIRPSAPFIGRFTVALLCVSTFGIAAATDTPAPSPMATSAATTLPTAKPRALRQPLLNLVLPAGTMMRFHSNLPLSSGEKDSGKPFTFTVLDDVVADGLLFIAAGAQGNGTIVLAGRAGANGHEGDLTIRLDDVSTADVNKLVFNDQRIRLNGRNRKVASAVLGFVPFIGLGSRLIRGSDIHVDPSTAILTSLAAPATVRARDDVGQSPQPSPSASSPSPEPSPPVSPQPRSTH